MHECSSSRPHIIQLNKMANGEESPTNVKYMPHCPYSECNGKWPR